MTNYSTKAIISILFFTIFQRTDVFHKRTTPKKNFREGKNDKLKEEQENSEKYFRTQKNGPYPTHDRHRDKARNVMTVYIYIKEES